MTKKYSELLRIKNDNSVNEAIDPKCLERLLDKAWQIRNFEIELYWKRSTYFYVFVSALFIAFCTIKKSDENDPYFLLLIAALGCVSSFVWCLSNIGSKFWQQNWENHIDLLEKEMGLGIYSLILGDRKEVFSVTKLNLYFSCIVFVVWCLAFLVQYISCCYCYYLCVILVIFVLIFFYYCGKSSFNCEREGKIDNTNIKYFNRKI